MRGKTPDTIFGWVNGRASETLFAFIQNGDGQGDLYETDADSCQIIVDDAHPSLLTVRRRNGEAGGFEFISRGGASLGVCDDRNEVWGLLGRIVREWHGEDATVMPGARMIGDMLVSINPYRDKWVIQPYGRFDPLEGAMTVGPGEILSSEPTLTTAYPEHRLVVFTDNDEVTVRSAGLDDYDADA